MRIQAILTCAVLGFLWGPLVRGQAAIPPYLGQTLPGPEATPFAPGNLNSGLSTRDITLLPDGTEIYVGVFLPGFRKAMIIETHQEAGRWTAPEVATFSRDPRWRCLEPCISPDGRQFFFVSDRPGDPNSEKPGPFGIWVMDRSGRGWSEARRLPEAVNGLSNTYYPSITRIGVLHFLREEGQGGWLMQSSLRSGTWSAAEKLPPPFNKDSHQANPRVDPGGRFILVPLLGRADSLSAYMAYRPRAGHTDAERDVICNIFDGGGANPLEAGAYALSLARKMLSRQASGVKLPILVMTGFWRGEEEELLRHDLTPAIATAEHVEAIERAARNSALNNRTQEMLRNLRHDYHDKHVEWRLPLSGAHHTRDVVSGCHLFDRCPSWIGNRVVLRRLAK